MKDDLDFITSIEPSRNQLLSALWPYLTDKFLLEMSYGEPDYKDHHKSLIQIRDSLHVEGKLPWHPGEVCNLRRHSNSEQLDLYAGLKPHNWFKWRHNKLTKQNAIQALFSCWVLICAYTQPDSLESGSAQDGDEATIASLCRNTLIMGWKYSLPVSEFLYWSYLCLNGSSDHRVAERPYYLFALFIVSSFSDNLLTQDEYKNLYKHLNKEEKTAKKLCHNCQESTSNSTKWLVELYGEDIEFENQCKKLVTIALKKQQSFGYDSNVQILKEMLEKIEV